MGPTFTHLWAGPLWPWVQGSGHQLTQQQLLHLGILQHHELQQVWGTGFNRPSRPPPRSTPFRPSHPTAFIQEVTSSGREASGVCGRGESGEPPRGVTFLDSARLRQRRRDGPRTRLQDGHPGLGTWVGRLSQAREKRGEACREPPHFTLRVSAPHGLPPPSPVSSSRFGTSLLPRVYPHASSAASTPPPNQQLCSWAQASPWGLHSVMGRRSSSHSRGRPWPSRSVTLAALGTPGRAPPRSTLTRPAQDAWCLGNGPSLRPGPPLPDCGVFSPWLSSPGLWGLWGFGGSDLSSGDPPSGPCVGLPRLLLALILTLGGTHVC